MRRLIVLVLFAGAVTFTMADYVLAGRCGGGRCGRDRCGRGHRDRCGHRGHCGHGHCGHVGHCGHGHCGIMPHGVHHAALEAPAMLVVHLPADAVLTVDGNATTPTSAVRTFRTPNLTVGQDYVYTLQARVGEQTVTQQVTVRAGQQTTVRLEPTVAVTQR